MENNRKIEMKFKCKRRHRRKIIIFSTWFDAMMIDVSIKPTLLIVQC